MKETLIRSNRQAKYKAGKLFWVIDYDFHLVSIGDSPSVQEYLFAGKQIMDEIERILLICQCQT